MVSIYYKPNQKSAVKGLILCSYFAHTLLIFRITFLRSILAPPFLKVELVQKIFKQFNRILARFFRIGRGSQVHIQFCDVHVDYIGIVI
jgi:hypothetical protein